MPVTRNIDYTAFDGLFAEQVIREMGGEKARIVFEGLINQGATKADILSRFRRKYPTWEATAERIAAVYEYLANGGGEGE